MMFKRLIFFAVLCPALSQSANILFDSNHAANRGCLAELAPSSAFFADMTQPSGETSVFVPPIPMIANAVDLGSTFYRTSDNVTGNHAPYGILPVPWSGYDDSLDDNVYAAAAANQAYLVYAFFPFSSLPNTATPPAAILAVAKCGAPTSDEYGQELCVSTGLTTEYASCPSDSPSDSTTTMGQVVAALQSNHPSWNWFDVKSALRQTAANWTTGYSHANEGYGAINYDAANGVNALYMQPPRMRVIGSGTTRITVTIYPFRQTRQVSTRLYSVPPVFAWPLKSEYVQADIDASGATLLATLDNSEVTSVAQITSAVTKMVTLIALSYDGAGAYSRVEEFSAVTVSVMAPPTSPTCG